MPKPRRKIARNLLDWISWFTPGAFFVLSCNDSRRPLGYMDFVEVVSERSGLEPWEVMGFSLSEDWNAIPFGKMRAFMKGCGVEVDTWADRQRIEKFWRRGIFSAARRSPDWEEYFLPIVNKSMKVMKERPRPWVKQWNNFKG